MTNYFYKVCQNIFFDNLMCNKLLLKGEPVGFENN